jgi:hypothetical protein
MGLTRKLVSENEKCRENYLMVSHFLKKMGWWHYWQEYVYENPGVFRTKHYINGMWFYTRDDDVHDVFGNSNFSTFLRDRYGIKVSTVLDLFMVFTYVFYREIHNRYCQSVNSWAFNYLNNNGYFKKWQEEVALKKASGLA